jgi:DMSO/TMAO reductase YedYZ molybdopterin-dependent catalytic subunit
MPDESSPNSPPLPPGQQLAARNKWPQVGEPTPSEVPAPWRLEIGGLVDRPGALTLDELRQLPRTEPAVDLHCVTR